MPIKALNSDGTLAGRTLEELEKEYDYNIFDDFFPFIDKYVYDPEYGGFMCNTDRKGNKITTNKSAWYEGRGIWTYSFAANKLDAEPDYLDRAKKSAELILSIPKAGDFWPDGYTRTGEPVTEKVTEYSAGSDIFCDLFVANGLQELAKAEGYEEYWGKAKDILFHAVEVYDRPDYSYDVFYGANQFADLEQDHGPGPRVLGHWMVLLDISTNMLMHNPGDSDIEALAKRCVDAIVNYHYNPEYGLVQEALKHDLSRTDDDFRYFVYLGHAIETMWMLMYEAVRLKDKNLWDIATDWFKRHVELAWDPIYNGLFRSLDHVNHYLFKTDKALWVQEEALIGMLCMIEHTGDEWAKDWFGMLHSWVFEKFPCKQYGYPLWILFGDRFVTFEEEYTRVGNFHHPRHLMLNLLSVKRIKERDGAISGVFGK